MNKKTLLFALPAVVGAAGLFSVPGVYADKKCDYTSDEEETINVADVVDCKTITLNGKGVKTLSDDLTLDKDDVTIVGKAKDGNGLKGNIIIQNAGGTVTFDNVNLYSATSGKTALIDIQSSNTNLVIKNSNVLWQEDGKEDQVDFASGTEGTSISIAESRNGSTITIDNSHIAAPLSAIKVSGGNNTININNASEISGQTAIDLASTGSTVSGNAINIAGGSTVTGYAKSADGGVIKVNNHASTKINVSGASTVANDTTNAQEAEDLFLFKGYASGSVIANGATLENNEKAKSYIFNDNSTDGGAGGNADFAIYDTEITTPDDHIVSDDKYVVTFETGYYNGRVNMVGVNTHGRINGDLIPVPKAVNTDLVFNGKWYTDISRAADTEFDFTNTDIDDDLTVYAGYDIASALEPGTNPNDPDNNGQDNPSVPGDPNNSQQPGDGNNGLGAPNAGDEVNNPDTADNIALYATIATLALLGLGATAFSAKKKASKR